MKNFSLILTIFLTFATFNLLAQETVDNPSIGYNGNASFLKITKVVMSDTATVVCFNTKYTPWRWIRIPENTYIQDNTSAIKHFIKASLNIPLAQQYIIPPSGEVSYQLIFPKINTKASSIDYGEDSDDGWKIYDIALQENKSVLLNPIYSSWYNKNNSKIEISFFNNTVVYNNKVWTYKTILKKPNGFSISITNGKEIKQVVITQLKNNDISLTTNAKTILLSKNQEACKKTIEKDTYQLPILKNENAIFSGYIKNYSPKIGAKTLMLYVDNIITGEQENKLIEIQANGYFSVKVPMYHPEQVFLRSNISNENNIYLEPGKELFVIIGDGKTKYLGPLAQLNEDLSKLNMISLFNYQDVQKRIVNMTPNEYKAYLLNLQATEGIKLDSIYKHNSISEKAYQIKKLNILFGYTNHIIEYGWNYESATQDVSKEFKKPVEEFPSDYYNFFDKNSINNDLSVISSDYNIFINRIKFLPRLTSERYSYTHNYRDIMNLIKKSATPLTENDRAFEKLISAVGTSFTTDSNSKAISDKWFKDRSDFISSFVRKEMSNRYTKLIDSAFGVNSGILIDLIKSQDIAGPIVSQLTPITDENLFIALSDIDNSFVKDYIKFRNNETKNQIAANKNKDGYFVNQTPKVEADKILDNILSKHKGKVVLLDFWATWCGPCLSGIEQIKPLKEEMKNSNVVFIYITNETSPLQTYQNIAPTIKGQHYRLKNDEWSYLADKFKITGIPHGVLINKEGKVVNPHLGFLENTEIKKLIQKYLQ